MITNSDIENIQSVWGEKIVRIGNCKDNKLEYENEAVKLLNELYNFENGPVLFKPTKASKNQFRLNFDSAKSYFIGGNSQFSEDNGFALNPWISVRFENSGVILNESHAFAMGNYFFKDESGIEVKVEYTFGYVKDKNGNIKINLHHSSLPFK